MNWSWTLSCTSTLSMLVEASSRDGSWLAASSVEAVTAAGSSALTEALEPALVAFAPELRQTVLELLARVTV